MTAQPGIDSKLWIGRAAKEAAPWLLALQAAGISRLGTLPMVERRPCPLSAEQRTLLAGLDQEDVLFLTSSGAVELLCAERSFLPALARCHVGVVGPATAAALQHGYGSGAGREADFVAHPADGAHLAEAFLRLDPRPSGRLVFFGAAHPHPELGEVLSANGLTLQRIAAYRVDAVSGETPSPGEAVVLFSPSSVESLAQRVDGPEHHPVYAIGGKTAAAARQCGFPVRATLAEPTPQALLDCFTNHDGTS